MSRFLVPGIDFGKKEINTVCPAIAPTLTGSELVTDGGLEAWTTPTNATNWTETTAGTSSVNQEAVTVHGGSNAARLDVDASNSNASISQNIASAGWTRFSAWLKASTGAVWRFTVNGGGTPLITVTTDFAQYVISARAINSVGIGRNSNASQSLYIDDVSGQAFTFPSLLVYLGTRNGQNGTYQCTPTVAVGSQAGIAICYASATNLLLAYVDRSANQAKLDKLINGTWSSVVAGAITYSAAQALKVIINGTNCSLYYNAVQVGSTTAVAELPTLGKQVHGFNTLAGNTVGTVTTSKATS